MSSITCPFCGQSDVTRASIVRDRGTVVSNTQATGYSFSSSGQVDVTTYYAETESQDEIARGLDSDESTSKAFDFWMNTFFVSGLSLVLVTVGPLIMFLNLLIRSLDFGVAIRNFNDLGWWRIMWIAALISLPIFILSLRRMRYEARKDGEREQHVQRNLQKSWYCNRCGHMWPITQ